MSEKQIENMPSLYELKELILYVLFYNPDGMSIPEIALFMKNKCGYILEHDIIDICINKIILHLPMSIFIDKCNIIYFIKKSVYQNGISFTELKNTCLYESTNDPDLLEFCEKKYKYFNNHLLNFTHERPLFVKMMKSILTILMSGKSLTSKEMVSYVNNDTFKYYDYDKINGILYKMKKRPISCLIKTDGYDDKFIVYRLPDHITNAQISINDMLILTESYDQDMKIKTFLTMYPFLNNDFPVNFKRHLDSNGLNYGKYEKNISKIIPSDKINSDENIIETIDISSPDESTDTEPIKGSFPSEIISSVKESTLENKENFLESIKEKNDIIINISGNVIINM